MNIRTLITAQAIIEATCKEFEIEEEVLKRRCRNSKVIVARQTAAYLMRQEKISINWVGIILGFNRASALMQSRVAKRVLEVDKEYQDSLNRIKEDAYKLNQANIKSVTISLKQ